MLVQYVSTRALHGPEIKAQARPANMIWGPSPARARNSWADPARALPANWIMKPGPARKKYVQARHATQWSYLRPRPGPSPRVPGRAIGPTT